MFFQGHNYKGDPPIDRVPILSAFVDQVLAVDLDFVQRALVTPLGKAVSGALDRLVAAAS